MTQTNNLKIDLVAQSQAQKEVTINEGLTKLEALQNRGAVDKDLSTPPVSPAEGAVYIVAASPTGAWTGKSKNIAYFNQGWKFVEPNEGLLIWVNDENKVYAYNGTAWVSYLDEVGIATSADSTNKLAVASDAVLFTAGSSGNMQLKFNKAASSNTATLLFQDGYSGRAEIGLAGDDDLRFKVSANGSSWNNAITVNRNNGVADFPSGCSVGAGTAMLKVLSTTASLDFPNIAANSSADLTVTLTGATVNSVVELGGPAAPNTGLIFMGYVSSTNTVTVRAFNLTASALNPAALTFRVMVTVF